MDIQFFQDFLSNFPESEALRAQIIDSNGFVIAGCSINSVGTFHEAAYHILRRMTDPDEDFWEGVQEEQGTLYTALLQNRQTAALLALSGEEQTVRIYARAVKSAIESMLGQEVNAVWLQKYSSKFDLFVQKLFYAPQVLRSELEARAASLGYLHDCMRIPVFITTEQVGDFSALVQQGKANPLYNPQDIMALSRSGNITLFIYLGYGEEVLRTFRESVTDYLRWWQDTLSEKGFQYQMQVGTIQSNLSYYRLAYDHAVWLHNTARCRDTVNWFYDYTEAYLKSSIPLMEYRGIFNAFSENLPTDFLESYKELFDSLMQYDFNFQLASKQMFIHKNTLSFGLGKIKERLNINPMQNFKQKEFASNFCLYLKMILS